ncbi:MAG: hypothetical protein ACRYHQ_15815, partial [Janthinobacterium lividum]
MRKTRGIRGRAGRIGRWMLPPLALASAWFAPAAQAAAREDVHIRVLSSKPYLVSGETALVQVQVP